MSRTLSPIFVFWPETRGSSAKPASSATVSALNADSEESRTLKHRVADETEHHEGRKTGDFNSAILSSNDVAVENVSLQTPFVMSHSERELSESSQRTLLLSFSISWRTIPGSPVRLFDGSFKSGEELPAGRDLSVLIRRSQLSPFQAATTEDADDATNVPPLQSQTTRRTADELSLSL